jgi:hypothetical protein
MLFMLITDMEQKLDGYNSRSILLRILQSQNFNCDHNASTHVFVQLIFKQCYPLKCENKER